MITLQRMDDSHFDAYFAGLFDGEGSVLIYRRKTLVPRGQTQPYNMRVTITNTHQGVIEEVRRRYGGNVFHTANPGPRRRPSWKWTALCRDAGAALEKWLPFLIIKKEEAEVAIRFQKILSDAKRRPYKGRRGQPPLSDDDVRIREELADELLRLRARSKPQLQTH